VNLEEAKEEIDGLFESIQTAVQTVPTAATAAQAGTVQK
jgi:hypothetical protein